MHFGVDDSNGNLQNFFFCQIFQPYGDILPWETRVIGRRRLIFCTGDEILKKVVSYQFEKQKEAE